MYACLNQTKGTKMQSKTIVIKRIIQLFIEFCTFIDVGYLPTRRENNYKLGWRVGGRMESSNIWTSFEVNYRNSNNLCGHLYIVLPRKLEENLVFRNYISDYNIKGNRGRLHLNLGHYTTITVIYSYCQLN